MIDVIFAADLNGGIGRDQGLPWPSLPRDMKRFRKLTKGNPVYMGRKTFESIGEPLPGRPNIVFTQNKEWEHTGVETMTFGQGMTSMLADKETTHCVIGGADVYEYFIPMADRVFSTTVHSRYPVDVRISNWAREALRVHFSCRMYQYWAADEKNPVDMTFANWVRHAS